MVCVGFINLLGDLLTKLFKIDRTGITKHINNIYMDEELEERKNR